MAGKITYKAGDGLWEAPLLIPLGSLIAGIVMAVSGFNTIWGFVFMISGITLSLAVNTVTWNRPTLRFKATRLQPVVILLLFSGIGVTDASLRLPREHSDAVAACGRVENISTCEYGTKIIVTVTDIISSDYRYFKDSNSRIIINASNPPLRNGDIITFPLRGKTKHDKSRHDFLHPFESYDPSRPVSAVCRDEEITVSGHRETVNTLSLKARNAMESVIEQTALSKDTKHFLIAILLGDSEWFLPDDRKDFSYAGLSHIMALSGMHIGILAGLLMLLLFPLNMFGHVKARVLITAVLLFGYAFLTGWNDSTVRACIMCACAAWALCLERRYNAWNALLLAAFIILLYSPFSLFKPGFQLSILAVAAIIFFYRDLNPIRKREHPLLHNMCGIILVPVIVTFATWCLAAKHFHLIPLGFFAANVTAVPFLPFYLGAAVMYFAFACAGYEPLPLRWILETGHSMLVKLVETVNDLYPPLLFEPSWLSVGLWTIALVLAAVALKSNRKIVYICPSLCIFLISGILFVRYNNTGHADGFMVNSGRNMVLSVRSNGYVKDIILPSQCVSEVYAFGKRIVAADKFPAQGKLADTNLVPCDILILSGNASGNALTLMKVMNPSTVITVSRIGNETLSLIDGYCEFRKIPHHSIKKQGPYCFMANGQD